MRRLLMVTCLVLLLCGGSTFAQAETVAQVGGNMLVNPSFEGTYRPQNDIGEIRVADGWRAWWTDGWRAVPGVDGGFDTHPTRRPEYNEALPAVDPHRVRTGQAAQHWFSFSGTSYAGVYQRVNNTQADRTYQAGVWAQGWCDNSDGNPHYCSQYAAFVSVGIDPDGGDWYNSRAIVWGQWQELTSEYRQYLSPLVVANGPRVTMFVSVAFRWGLRHNDAYLDDASLVDADVGGGECPVCPVCPVCPEPTPCPDCPPCPGGGEAVDYGRIESLMRQVFREEWPTP